MLQIASKIKKCYDKHGIDIDSLSFCLQFTNDYKVRKFWGVSYKLSCNVDIVMGYTHKYCKIGGYDGVGGVVKITWV